MNKRQLYNGQIYKNGHGYEFEVTDYKDAKHVTVQFCDETRYTVEVTSSDILRGKVKNLYGKTVHGIGYFGVGPYKSEDYSGKMTKQYSCWIGMLDRCYKRTSLTYEDKFVNPLWHCFQNFAEWCKDRKGFDNLGWELDKDLIKLGNKEYGPNTCAFVPQEINVLVSSTSKVSRGQYPVGTYFHKNLINLWLDVQVSILEFLLQSIRLFMLIRMPKKLG